MGVNGVLRCRDRICAPACDELKGMILEDGHKCHLSIHSSMTKM